MNEIKEGYWWPHTSSIDFCEPNYAVTGNIVEFHNAWSSIAFLSGVGIFGLWKGNPTKEWRVAIAYLILVLIGIGSTLLHGTLHWLFQSSDELPMLYMAIGFFYCVLECETPIDHPPRYYSWPWFVALAFVNTIIYYTFQKLYVLFLLSFTVVTLIVTLGLVRMLYQKNPRSSMAEAKAMFWLGELYFTAIGVTVWVFDMMLCNAVVLPISEQLPGWTKGITPHILWHFAAALGAYVLTTSLTCCRLISLGIPHHVSYMCFGMLPIISLPDSFILKKR